MKVTLNKILRTPAGIVKRTLPILLVGVFLIACNRDLLFVDELLTPASGNDLLVYKYEAEVSTYTAFFDPSKEGNLTRTIPTVQRTKFEFRMSKSGEVEIFTDYLVPSKNYYQTPSVNLAGEVKYEHFNDGTVKLYDSNRTVVGEYSAQKGLNKYNELYQSLIEIDNPKIKSMVDLTLDQMSKHPPVAARAYTSLTNAYDDHPDYKVYRNSVFDEDTNEELINEIIVHEPSDKVHFISGYSVSGEVLSRSEFGYEAGKLVALVETRIDQTDPTNPFTKVVSTKYDNYEFNLNLE